MGSFGKEHLKHVNRHMPKESKREREREREKERERDRGGEVERDLLLRINLIMHKNEPIGSHILYSGYNP